MQESGTLWVVATPIGNLGDLSPRAAQVLASVALIAAEDTRHSQKLLSHAGLSTAMTALHEHNEERAVSGLIERLLRGDDIALVSDAGTPLVSDPGFRLVRAAREAGIRVSPVPGPCAAIAALSVAGLASDRFVFEGFLPAKSSARRERLQALVAEARTMIFYESSHRIADTLQDMQALFGPTRTAAVARELTKLHETVLGQTLADIAVAVDADSDQRRGEFVVMVAGQSEEQADPSLDEARRLLRVLRGYLSPSQAARAVAELTGLPKRSLYQLDDRPEQSSDEVEQ